MLHCGVGGKGWGIKAEAGLVVDARAQRGGVGVERKLAVVEM